MRYCKKCGFPVPYGRFLEWTSDGTILGREQTRTRLVYLDVDEIRNILDGVSEWMGIPIDRIVYRAEKEVGRRFIKALLPGFFARVPRGRLARPTPGVKAIGHFVFNYMAGLCMGKAEVIDYRSAVGARVRVTNGHCIPLVAGDGAGVFEHLEKIGVDADWERVRSDEYVINLEKTADEPDELPADRLTLEKAEYLPGQVSLDHCGKCGVPHEVTDSIYLDLDKGVLRNKITGMRLVALPAQSFNAVFRELFRELGSQLPSVVERREREYTREGAGVRYTVKDLGDEGLVSIFSDFPWKGIGNPTSARETGEGLEVTVENPFLPQMVAGRVAGQYENWIDGSVESGWTEESPGRLKVTLKRA
jgi:hypothetical protein